MIAKKIKPPQSDDFDRLAYYIAAAKEDGEKLDRLWIGNCDAGSTREDLEPALAEIGAVRALHNKPELDRSYHLVVSFRAPDRPSLTEAALQDMATTFLDRLGFSGHQYVAATHINTDNFHMHLAINKVHPGTGTLHTPYRDFPILEKTCRAMEQKYGLAVDPGRADRGRNPLSPAARDVEARTWEESFQRFLQDNKADILDTVATAPDWSCLHDRLADRYRIALVPRGRGLVFRCLDPTHRKPPHMKASALDRACSRGALEERLGPYRAPPDRKRPPRRKTRSGQSIQRYRLRPLAGRGFLSDHCWRRYLALRQNTPAASQARNWRLYLTGQAATGPMGMNVVDAMGKVFGKGRGR